MTEKIEVSLTFADFAQKNKSVLSLKHTEAGCYQKLLTCKAIEDQTKDYGFSDSWKKELTDKIDSLKKVSEEELKIASENINTYLFNLIKAIFEYHRAVIEMPKDECLKNYAKIVRGLIAAGGGQLEPEFVFNAIKVLYINC